MLLSKNYSRDYELCDEVVIRDLLPFHDKPIVITLCKKTKRFAIVIACGTCDNENGHFNFK
jgi:hypothetical protein